jgi:hypothetical protein
MQNFGSEIYYNLVSTTSYHSLEDLPNCAVATERS